MTSSSPTANPAISRSRRTLAITAAIIAALVVAFFIFTSLYTDVLWYDQLGFLNVLTTQWVANLVMFLIGFVAMAVPVWLSIEVAFRFRPVYAKLNSQLDRYQQVIEPLRRVAMYGIPTVFGLFAGIASANGWQTTLLWLNRSSFGETDPQFGLDIGFYVFELPFYQAVVGFASAVVLISGVAAIATSYLYGALRFNGREVRISKTARIQLATTAALYLLIQSASLWLDQYARLTSDVGLLTGASYTDVNAVIPGRQILAIVAALVAVLFLVSAVIGRWRLPIIGTALLLVSGLVVGSIYPWVVQRFQVQPSEQSLEAEYLQRNIDATRAAYGVSDVEEQGYTAVTDAEPGALQSDAQTTASIRIIDPALITDAFGQLEQFRQYYAFPEYLDVDRYEIDGQLQDTVLAVRELNQDGISSPSWFNNTLVYTHGYGVVAAYGNQRSADGQPVFLQSGIPSQGALGEFEPRVYFGENSPAYSIVGAPEGTEPVELDYPAGEGENAANAEYTFQGDGGPKLDNAFKRLIYSLKFQSEQIFLSDGVNEESQILYDRNPRERVQKVAPYLTLDNDIYPAVVDEQLVWIVDGYTTTDRYPYSDTNQLETMVADTYQPEPALAINDVNYIRNSVKATVNAYDGSVTLYAWDDQDPILESWQKIFPSTLEPMSEMSAELLSHVRYPADLFKAQRYVLGQYHVTQAGSFYSGDDAWRTPAEPTAGSTNPPLQPPYYLTLQLPEQEEPTFSLYSTFIPADAGGDSRNVLTGYLAVNADAGSTEGEISEDYGKLTLLTLPRQTTVPGPGQAQNNFNADSTVSQQLNILRQGETQVISGNLLTLPVGGGLLYVQPVYVRSTGETSYPVLQRVLVAFGDQIAFEPTLDEALDTLFGGDSGADAGDTGVEAEDPVDGEEAPTAPTEDAGSDPGAEADNPELAQALADAADALADREAAYSANDLVAAAEADERLQAALEAAIAAQQ
ncbi:UPF0182 family membrane protein [Herbiconiux sp. SYSU D00978]|uniref:UPF0182 family membrane protein n=1 Tax=Herbiconiux sp. SYSU D00978 TaxID=2812562 RepID=UPI001F61D3DF|nr:UPF0182 family protein [Herbiconiux sp. SYSU D00978]